MTSSQTEAQYQKKAHIAHHTVFSCIARVSCQSPNWLARDRTWHLPNYKSCSASKSHLNTRLWHACTYTRQAMHACMYIRQAMTCLRVHSSGHSMHACLCTQLVCDIMLTHLASLLRGIFQRRMSPMDSIILTTAWQHKGKKRGEEKSRAGPLLTVPPREI